MHRIILLLLLCLFPLAAQTDRATLTGTIKDPHQGLVGAAQIAVKSAATGVEYHVISNSAGVYVVSSLPVGEYTASVACPGFQVIEFKFFTLQVGETRTLNATLSLAMVGTTVQVNASAEDFDRTSAEVGGVIEGAQLNELPMNGRSLERLESLVPGAIDDGGSTQDQIRFVGLSQEDNKIGRASCRERV